MSNCRDSPSFGVTRFDGKQSIPSLGILTSEGGLPRQADCERPRCRVLSAGIFMVSPCLRPLIILGAVNGTLSRVIFGKEIVNFLPHARFEGMLGRMRLCFHLSYGYFSMVRSDAHVGEVALVWIE